MMWDIRDGRTHESVGINGTHLTALRSTARRKSASYPNVLEVVHAENGEVLFIYSDGREFISNEGMTGNENMYVSDDLAEEKGRRIWVDLAERQRSLVRLLKKLTLSPHEQRQFSATQDKIADRETELMLTLSDTEYQCAYYTFMEQGTRTRSYERPNYCDRQIRRYVKKALQKTGQVAERENWSLIRIGSAELLEGPAASLHGIHPFMTGSGS